ncbi:hypothetical protein MMC13_002132 [Lambiella insularis]|nr:hypothetical protein [Lambiella insularis]
MSSNPSGSELHDLNAQVSTWINAQVEEQVQHYANVLGVENVGSLPFGSRANIPMDMPSTPPVTTPSLSFSDPGTTETTIVFVIVVKTPSRTYGPYHRQVQATITWKAMMAEIEKTVQEEGGYTWMCRWMIMLKETVVEHMFQLHDTEENLEQRWSAAIGRILDPVWGFKGEVILNFE